MSQKNPTETRLVGNRADGWLSQPGTRTAEIHSTFDNVVNLRTEDDRLISFVTRRVPLSPFSVTVRELPTEHIPADAMVTVSDAVLQFNDGDWQVDCRNRRTWNHDLSGDSRKVNPESLGSTIRRFETRLDRVDEEIGLLKVHKERSLPEQSGSYLQRCREGFDAVEEAFRYQNKGRFLEGIKQLAGTGKGLTPSGDDAIVGVLAGLSVFGKNGSSFTESLRDAVLETARGRVSWFSYRWMTTAREGSFAKPVRDLVRCFRTDASRSAFSVAVRNLSDLGSSSGMDLCAGLLLVLRGCSQGPTPKGSFKRPM